MSQSDAWLVVGLGNPGPTYASTRHNIGAMAVDELARRLDLKLSKHNRAIAEVAQGHIDGHQVILAKPLSFMNTSGGPVKALLSFYKISLEHIVVLHDELDIPLGAIRVKSGGGDNGHNGLKSIRSSLGTGEWFRIRLGIGRPPGRQDPADFVLKPFGSAQAVEAHQLADAGADVVVSLITEGLLATQNRWNT